MNNKTKNLILKKIFKNYSKKQVNAIILFWSRARGDFREDSDYDINVYISCKEKKISYFNYYDDKYHISFVDKEKFREYLREGHSFLFCTFMDGKIIYQNKNWFDKKRKIIMNLKPSKEIIVSYLKYSNFNIISAKRKIDLFDDLFLEDIKVAANQIGFALVMLNKKYPISSHTLQKEIKQLNKKYLKIAEIINYFHKKYYFNEGIKKKCYKQKLNEIYLFGKKLLKENFLEEYKKIMKTEKISLKNNW